MLLISQDKHKCWRVGRGIQRKAPMMSREHISQTPLSTPLCGREAGQGRREMAAHALVNKKNLNVKY